MGMRVALVVAGVVVVLAAITTGGIVRDDAVAAASAATHAVATVVGTATGAPGPAGSVLVPAVWTAPDGSSAGGAVAVATGAGIGATVDLWLDPDGAPVTPRGTGPAATAGLLAGGGVLLGGGLLLGLAWWLSRRRLLDREWAAVEPLWSALR